MPDTDELAERYLSAVERFCELLLRVPPEKLDVRSTPDSWSARDVAFHVADVDQMLGLRLRRILSEDTPRLAGVDSRAMVEEFRRARLDPGLALDSLRATSALNVGVVERLKPEQLARKGRWSAPRKLSQVL